MIRDYEKGGYDKLKARQELVDAYDEEGFQRAVSIWDGRGKTNRLRELLDRRS